MTSLTVIEEGVEERSVDEEEDLSEELVDDIRMCESLQQQLQGRLQLSEKTFHALTLTLTSTRVVVCEGVTR